MRMNAKFPSFVALICIWVAACTPKTETPKIEHQMTAHDPHSWSRPDEVAVKHLNLDIEVDFENRILKGHAILDIENKTGTDSLILDSRFLKIEKITLGSDEKETTFSLSPEHELMGSSLSIKIEKNTKIVKIYYSTTEKTGALQWLAPVQTSGKAQPFLFTQSQAILARTWIPIQDGPGIRFTYEATVKVPPQLMAVMSAVNSTQKNAEGRYIFKMDKPIPAYLMALAVGDFVFENIGERTGVYAEKNIIAKAKYEFGEMENMLVAAEKLYGPYRWGRYDVIVLPPSFPFGGMENPKLTFATPTILAGDRSLTSLIAHEMAHSWSGNLVTNATWDDFWLNEGFTVYFENRIMEAIYGRDFSEMEALLAKQELDKTIQEFMKEKPADTKLKWKLAGRDPEEGLTDIAYIKGFFFLRLMEESAGREKFDSFLRKYFDTHAFTSMTTEGFVKYANAELIGADSSLGQKINMNEWIFAEGLPKSCPIPQSSKFENVEAQLKNWEKGTALSALDINKWSTQEWLHFLRHLPDSLEKSKMTELDKEFKFTQSGNSEILCEWLTRCIQTGYTNANSELEAFLFNVGRRKFLKPLYAALIKTESGRAQALKYYARSRPNYHFVAANTLDVMLDYKPN